MTISGITNQNDLASNFVSAVYDRRCREVRRLCREYSRVFSANLVNECLFEGAISRFESPSRSKSPNRHPALFVAIGWECCMLTETLLKLGANPNYEITGYYCDRENFQRPLWSAVKARHVGIIALLLKYGAEMREELFFFSTAQSDIDEAKSYIKTEETRLVSILTKSIPGMYADLSGIILSYLKPLSFGNEFWIGRCCIDLT